MKSAPLKSPIRVLILDDHPIVRAGLRMLIESHPGMRVIGDAAEFAEALAAASRERPEVVVLDLELGATNCVEEIPRLLAAAPGARILILTASRDRALHARAVELGALGVVLKDQANDVILEAIEKVHGGATWLDGDILGEAFARLASSRQNSHSHDSNKFWLPSLTKREREIVALVCQGYKNQQVADRMAISEGTVRNHLTVIYEKLGVSDRFGLIIHASQHGFSES